MPDTAPSWNYRLRNAPRGTATSPSHDTTRAERRRSRAAVARGGPGLLRGRRGPLSTPRGLPTPGSPLPAVGVTVAPASRGGAGLQCLRTGCRAQGARDARLQASRGHGAHGARADRPEQRPGGWWPRCPFAEPPSPLRPRQDFSRSHRREPGAAVLLPPAAASLASAFEEGRGEDSATALAERLRDSGPLASLLRPVPSPPQGLFLVENNVISLTRQPDS